MSAFGYRHPAFCNHFDDSALHVPSPRAKKLPLKSSHQNIRTWPAKLLTRCFLSAPSNPRHRSAPPRTRNAETKDEPLAVKEKLRYLLNQDTVKRSMQSLSSTRCRYELSRVQPIVLDFPHSRPLSTFTTEVHPP